jgi:hypothetical protein
LYFHNLVSSTQVQIRDSSFANNKALQGGAVFTNVTVSSGGRDGQWFLPQLVNITFNDNKAEQHGKNIATNAVSTRFWTEKNSTTEDDKSRAASGVLDLDNTETSGMKLSLYSGDVLPSLSVSPFDAYGQRLSPDLSQARLVRLAATSSPDSSVSTEASLVGDVNNILLGKVTVFDYIRFVGQAPPARNLSDTLGTSAARSFVSYNVTMYEVTAAGDILSQLDWVPVKLQACDQVDGRREVDAEEGLLFKTCEKSKTIETLVFSCL